MECGQPVSNLLPQNDFNPKSFGEESKAGSQSKSCLLIDDNEAVLTTLTMLMESAGYHCTSCATADEGRDLLKQNSDFGVLISDIRTPGKWSGADLARWASNEFPDIGVVLVSGDESPTDLGNCRFLRKPFRFAELNQVLRDLTP